MIKNRTLSYLVSAILFLIGLILVMLCGFGAIGGGDGSSQLLTVVVSSVGSSLIATAVYVLLTSLATGDRLQEAEQIFVDETRDLHQSIVDACNLINSGDVYRIVDSDEGHAVAFGPKFECAKRIDIACHTGGTIIDRNKEYIKNALRNGAIIRILFNNANYEFFDPDNLEYENLQSSFCPDKASRVFSSESIKTIKKAVDENVADAAMTGTVAMFYSDGIITGQMVIIDGKEAYYTPYLPAEEINESFRVEFSESALKHIKKLEDSFSRTWAKMISRTDVNGRRVNEIYSSGRLPR